MIPLEKIKPEHRAVLTRIQNSIPKEYFEKLIKKGKLSEIDPKVKLLKEKIIKGITDMTNPPELRKKCQLIIDSEELDTETQIVDKFYEKKIDKFIEEEVLKAEKRGELPKRKNLDKNIKRIIHYKNGTGTNKKS